MRSTTVIYADMMIQNATDTTINHKWCIAYATYNIQHNPEIWVVYNTLWYYKQLQHTYSMTVKHNATKYYNREGSRFVFSQQSTKFHIKWNMHYWAVGLIVRLHAPWKKWMMRNITYVWHHTQTRVEWKVGCISWRAAMVTWNDGRCKFPSPITEPTMNNVLANVSLDI